ncbi:DUF3817 domain-containing protein [Bdellovibrio sp. NC01]|uniref:DUF3817 domain-containing protein n=1 Tax=Bdellovibrio sp. NC01 TaxID=2220073 RepID=UPI00143DC3D6|nr:DUF3817 domain-containing protein [Bdellovibrio sp. NC01]
MSTSYRLKYFRFLTFLEGCSLLILMFVAMPARAIMHDPTPVRIMGMIHGILFLMFFYTLLTTAIENKWSLRRLVLALFAASLPFGSFWFDRKYLKTT